MEFFLPHASEEVDEEENYQAIRKFLSENAPGQPKDRRIYELTYTHDGEEHTATVGEPHPVTGEDVIAIFESSCWLICTPSRGVLGGVPIMASKGHSDRVVEFEGSG